MTEDEQRQLAAVQADLLRQHPDQADVVRAQFEAIVAELQEAPIRTFVPVIVQRRVRESLERA